MQKLSWLIGSYTFRIKKKRDVGFKNVRDILKGTTSPYLSLTTCISHQPP